MQVLQQENPLRYLCNKIHIEAQCRESGDMRREDLFELHYIAPLENVVSIYQSGILSNKLAQEIKHESLAWEKMQERRSGKVIPGGSSLHDYVNLYICARNPMLYKVKNKSVCVLRVDPNILDSPGVVIANSNAAGDYVRFASSPSGLDLIDADLVFAESWIHPNEIETWNHKGIKCAEVLVPDRVDTKFIENIYVPDAQSQEILDHQLKAAGLTPRIMINKHLFFRR